MADTKFLKDNLTGFIPQDIAAGILNDIARGSSIMQLSDIKQMKTDHMEFNVWADKPGAYWVNESERINTSKASWIKARMEAKKLAVIIPVTKEKLNDVTINVFEELKPEIAQAFYTAIDKACLFGESSPFAKNVFGVAQKVQATGLLVDDISATMAAIEENEIDPNGFVSSIALKRELRNLKDDSNNSLAVMSLKENSLFELPLSFCRNGAFNKETAQLICGDWSKSIFGIREGIQFEILKEATLHNVTMGDGKPLSLAENDMIAIKATMRVGYLPIKDKAFAVLQPEARAKAKSK